MKIYKKMYVAAHKVHPIKFTTTTNSRYLVVPHKGSNKLLAKVSAAQSTARKMIFVSKKPAVKSVWTCTSGGNTLAGVIARKWYTVSNWASKNLQEKNYLTRVSCKSDTSCFHFKNVRKNLQNDENRKETDRNIGMSGNRVAHRALQSWIHSSKQSHHWDPCSCFQGTGKFRFVKELEVQMYYKKLTVMAAGCMVNCSKTILAAALITTLWISWIPSCADLNKSNRRVHCIWQECGREGDSVPPEASLHASCGWFEHSQRWCANRSLHFL